MTAKQFRNMSADDRYKYAMACAARDNEAALLELRVFEEFMDKPVRVVKGRKVPIGTTGTCFWIGMRNYSKYKNWWSWEAIIGFRDDQGEVFFTNERNLEVIREEKTYEYQS